VSSFKAGHSDYVWLSTRNISFDTPAKFKPTYVGSLKILDMINSNAARLDLPPTYKARRIHDVFNATVGLLQHFVERPVEMGPQRVHNPPPLADTPEGPLWEVERVTTSYAY
jgi:hypothetical protein